jgi:TRAP-type mannitol/chloroaromatic compound transport system permease large subunit
MLRLGYDRNLAIGTTCAGGALGTMLPPSIVLIIYGLTANVSIGDLFKGAFLPAFILAMLYIAYVLTRVRLNPSLAPLPTEQEATRHRLQTFLKLCCSLFSRSLPYWEASTAASPRSPKPRRWA